MVKVPFNEALYERNYCGSIVCPTSRALVRDALAVWVQQQLDAGKTLADVTAYLKTFDKQDRYDVDGDGDFNEPDGFIDDFQIVHAAATRRRRPAAGDGRDLQPSLVRRTFRPAAPAGSRASTSARCARGARLDGGTAR